MKLITILSFQFFSLFCFSQNRWTHVSIDSAGKVLTGIINDKGELIVPASFQMIIGDNDFYFVKKDNLWGCYDNKGANIIPVIYQSIGTKISEGLARVMNLGKWGFVDLKNNLIVDFKYSFACNFKSGKAYVTNDKQKYYINRKDEILEETSKDESFCFEDLSPDIEIKNQFSDSLLVVMKKNDKFGVIEIKTGNIIIPYEYDEIGRYFGGTILVRSGKKWGAYIDDGNLITEPKYKSVGIFWDN
jgi:WG containing repeat